MSTTLPPRWNSGSESTSTAPVWNRDVKVIVESSARRSQASVVFRLLAVSMPWVSSAPFGRPVVPEV